MADVIVLPIDPFDPVASLLVPAVTQRIKQFAEENFQEADPHFFASSIMARLMMRDPNLVVVALLEPTTGKVVGHGVATIETEGTRKWVFVSQCKADGNVGDAIMRGIELADKWGRQRGASHMVMSTTRSDTSWKKKYQFETMRHLMIRLLGNIEEGADD